MKNVTTHRSGVVRDKPQPDIETPRRPAVLDTIRRAHARGTRLVGFCSGAFTLAEAGVLDGRRATAHWQWADAFHSRFPAVRLEPDVLFVDDGDILTAAGSAAALDLGLPDESLAPVLTWAQQRLDTTLTIAGLAAHAAVSPATLHRRFQAQLGTTPLAWLTAERITLARRLIELGESRFDVVARRTGLGTATNLRALMRRETGLTPSAYRRRFGQVKPAPAR